MPPKLVRITLDTMHPHVQILEYGEVVDRTITSEELEELDTLDGQLTAYSDFDTADSLEDEKRRELMSKKKRYEELKALEQGESEIEWTRQDVTRLRSLLVMIRGDWIPVYVENIPIELLEKMLDPKLTEFTVNIPVQNAPLQHIYEPEPKEEPKPDSLESPETRDEQVFMVKEAIKRIGVDPTMGANAGQPWLAEKTGDGYHGLVYVSRDCPGAGQTSLAGVVYAWPVVYMKTDWDPVNKQLKSVFEKKLDWVRTEPGKFSHWMVKF